jgi:hypothetical protein
MSDGDNSSIGRERVLKSFDMIESLDDKFLLPKKYDRDSFL